MCAISLSHYGRAKDGLRFSEGKVGRRGGGEGGRSFAGGMKIGMGNWM